MEDDLKQWAAAFDAKPGDLILLLAGETHKTRKALSELRLEMASRLGFRNPEVFAPLWVVDFPLLEFDAESNRFYAMHPSIHFTQTRRYYIVRYESCCRQSQCL